MLLWAILVAGLACAHSSDDRIVGGIPTNINLYPYNVALLFDEQRTGNFLQVCGGSILNEDSILTAAHCTERTTADQWKIRAGSKFHDSDGQVIPVRLIIMHQLYDTNTNDNDIAVLRLLNKLVYRIRIAPVILPVQDEHFGAGTQTVITGWGRLSENGAYPAQLYVANVALINRNKCAAALIDVNPVTENMICAGNLQLGGVDSCQGDSGGPMTLSVQTKKQIGIISWGKGCAQPWRPGVYTKVSNYINWINQNIL